jgi:RNA polymerase sigma factor (sigma-70 family)
MLARRVERAIPLRYLDVEDLVQVGMIEAARAMARYDEARGPVSSWIVSHAYGPMVDAASEATLLKNSRYIRHSRQSGSRGAYIDSLRFDGNYVQVDDSLDAAPDCHTPDDSAIASERRANLLAALEALPRQIRIVIVRSAWRGESRSKTARVIRRSKAHTQRLHTRGLALLAAMLPR